MVLISGCTHPLASTHQSCCATSTLSLQSRGLWKTPVTWTCLRGPPICLPSSTACLHPGKPRGCARLVSRVMGAVGIAGKGR